MALVTAPGLLGELLLSTDCDVIVAIGQLRNHGPTDPGLGFRHQTLQFRRTVRKELALSFELLAVVEIVFGGIGERRRHGVANLGAAAKGCRERKQH